MQRVFVYYVERPRPWLTSAKCVPLQPTSLSSPSRVSNHPALRRVLRTACAPRILSFILTALGLGEPNGLGELFSVMVVFDTVCHVSVAGERELVSGANMKRANSTDR